MTDEPLMPKPLPSTLLLECPACKARTLEVPVKLNGIRLEQLAGGPGWGSSRVHYEVAGDGKCPCGHVVTFLKQP